MYYGERFNTISHLVGALLSLAALVLLVIFSAFSKDPWKIVSFSIYGVTLLLLYTASTCYHWVSKPMLKKRLRKLDYISIYLLIAGSYTPFTLLTLRGPWGWSLFGVVWTIALLGMIKELVLGQKTWLLSVAMLVAMGWAVVIAIIPLIQNLSGAGLFWLVFGGILYSSGVYFLVNDEKICHGHGIWHLFVLAGSISQFISIFFYL